MTYWSVVDIPSDILRYKIDEALEHVRDDNVLYVTDLIYCPRKVEYSREFPELGLRTINGITIHGEIVHIGIEVLLKKIYGEYIVTELEGGTEGVKTVTTTNGRVYKIKGRIDAILNIDGRRIGVEIKSTVNGDKPIPSPWHVSQAMIYNWLLDLEYTILLYVSPSGIHQHVVNKRMTEESIVKLVERAIAPAFSWECEKCPFNIICPIYRMQQRRGNT